VQSTHQRRQEKLQQAQALLMVDQSQDKEVCLCAEDTFAANRKEQLDTTFGQWSSRPDSRPESHPGEAATEPS
jgi:hypothetical protein